MSFVAADLDNAVECVGLCASETDRLCELAEAPNGYEGRVHRRTSSAILAAGLWATGSAGLYAEEVRDNAPWRVSASNPPTVIIDDQPSEPMSFAAEELRRYLSQILGAKLPDAPPSKQAPAIRLSIHPNADLTEEGYEFRADGPIYHITAGGPLGLVFGTYEFLRRFGGCRFSDLGPDGEYVPRKDRLDADPGPLRMKPKLWYRGLQFSFYEDPELCRQRIDWMAKNGLNCLMYKPEPDDADPQSVVTLDPQTGVVRLPEKCQSYWPFTKGWFDKVLRPEVRKRGLKLDMNHHNLLYWLPTRRYLTDHPDWYAEVDGKRGVDLKQLCICTSNPDAVNTLIENIRAYLRQNREVKVVGVIPQDHMGMCQCKKCVAGDLDPKDAFRSTSWSTGNPSKALRYARLLNAVAAAIRQEFPDVTVGGEAYHDLLWPPKTAIDPQTTIWLAVHMRDGCRPIAPDATSDTNREIHAILRQWKEVYRGRLILYEYYMGMNAHRSLPYPMSEVICDDWTHLKQLGVDGATVQCWTTNHSAYALNNLAFARSGWYDRVDNAEVLDDYLLGAYGSAGESLRPIFDGLICATRQLARNKGIMRPSAGNISYFLDKVGRDTIRRSLEEARAKAGNDRERRQVEKLAAATDYWTSAADVFQRNAEANRLAGSDPKAALAVLDQLLDQKWTTFDEVTKWSRAPGWICITVPNQWEGTKAAASALRDKVRARLSPATRPANSGNTN